MGREGKGRKGRGRGEKGGELRGGEGKGREGGEGRAPQYFIAPQFQFSRNMSDADVFMVAFELQDDSLYTHRDTSYQKITINCNKLS